MNRLPLRRLTLAILASSACLAGCETTSASDGDASTSGDVTANFSSLYSNYLNNCAQCHAPGAPGATSTIESSLDFSTQATAYSTLTGAAGGLSGNQQACNGVPFIVKGNPASSLLVAVLDSSTRATFDLAATPGCDNNAISDMVLKTGKQPSAAFISALKTWIQNGAVND